MNARNVLVQTQRAYSIYSTATQTSEVELLRYIDATGFASGTLVVRLQEGDLNNWPNTTVVTVKLQNVSPAPDDPASLYTENADVAAVTFTKGTDPSAPTMKADDFTAPISGYLRCLLTVTSTSASGAVDFTIGINVVGRNG